MLPAAASIKKQGANNGAVTSFLISTPETGVDSVSITYALLDPIMTVARPLAALITAVVTGLAENFSRGAASGRAAQPPDLSCTLDNCCDGVDCAPEEHAKHHTLGQRATAGLRYAAGELWDDLAAWFLAGILIAGAISALVPQQWLSAHLGGGMGAMLIMLAAGIPLYICATASTPIAAALILKGVSPGAALVFLLAGPATNVTSLTMLVGILGKRATALYLAGIAIMAVLCGLLVDQLYLAMGIDAKAIAGQASELVPHWLRLAAALVVLALSARSLGGKLVARLNKRRVAKGPAPMQDLDSLMPTGCQRGGCACSSHQHGGGA